MNRFKFGDTVRLNWDHPTTLTVARQVPDLNYIVVRVGSMADNTPYYELSADGMVKISPIFGEQLDLVRSLA